ncbi:hypothetical protein [Fontivita pretiosa]|uniref:hypothetical protein n=1 Tax=Fontivita pretiosa TaxID=2989684 RepID=UPI003D18467B
MNAKVPKLSICTLVPLVTCLLCVRGGAQTSEQSLPEGWQNYTLAELVTLAQRPLSSDAANELLRFVFPRYLAGNPQFPDADRAQRNALAKALGPRMSQEQWQQLLLRIAAETPPPTDFSDVLNLWIGDLADLAKQFAGMPDSPTMLSLRRALAAYAWQNLLRPDVPLAEADRENWLKLLAAVETQLSLEQRQQTIPRLAAEAAPSEANRMLAGGTEPLRSEGLQAPPLTPVLNAEQRNQVAGILEARFLGPDRAALLGLEFDQMLHLWVALGRCGRDMSQLSEMTAQCIVGGTRWRSWSRKGLATALVYLQWSDSAAAAEARRLVVDACAQQRIYRFDADPIYAGRSGMCVDQQLREYLEQNLVDGEGGVRESVAALLSWRYSTSSAEAVAWERRLDEKLADPTLVGDRKAMWLLARAYAQAVGGHWDPMSGEPWVQRALAAAESELPRLTAVGMLVRAYVQETDFDRAQALLAGIAQQMSPEGQQQLTAELGAVIAFERERAQRYREEHRQAVEAAWHAELHRRLDAARVRNDAEAISRYEQLLSSP